MLRGSAWLGAARISIRLLEAAQLVVLARLLSPSAFGLMTIAIMAMGLARRLSTTGFNEALIQKQGDISSYLGTAWTVNLIRDLILAVGMVITAPLVADFFDAPKARPVLQIVAIGWLFSGLRNRGLVYLHKELLYNRFFLYHMARAITQITLAVGLAVVFRSVWALVLGFLAAEFVGLILSYIIAPRPDRISFDLQKARELFSFGKWILGRDILAYVMNQLDKIVVGRLAGVATLGLYNVAYQIATLTNKELVRVAGRVTFPAYSKLRSDGEIMREAYLKVVQITSLIALPIAIGMLLLADGLVRHVLGDQWLPTVNTLRILSLWAALESLSLIAVPLLSGMGRPDVPAKTNAVRLVLLMALIYPFTKWVGMPGAALAVATSSAAVAPWLWLSSLSMVNSNLWQMAKAMAPALFATAALAIAVLLLRETVLAPSSLVRFVALGIAGGLAYLGALASWAILFRWNPAELLSLAPGKEEPDMSIQQSTAD